MSFNIVDIKVVSDYTEYSSTVRFHLNVPVSKDDATAIYKTLASGPWSDVEAGITKAVQASAPTPIQTLVAALLQAYAGTTPSTPVTPEKKPASNDGQ